jgi:general L-amino acid transport system substrate-binding protein
MLTRYCALFLLAGAVAAPNAGAQSRLDEIKARGRLTCAALPRPGLASLSQSGWKGLYPDICHAVTVATLGPDGKFAFEGLDLPKDGKALDAGAYDVLFLTEPEIVENGLGGKVAPGPAAFFESYAVMVEKNSAVKALDDLAGVRVCLHEADAATQAFEERLAQKGASFVPMAFQEDIELLDAYNSRHCQAVASEATDLIDLRQRKGVNHFDSRILPDRIAVFPVVAATPIGDPQWSTAVTWVVHFLHAAERPQTKWRAGGAAAIGVDATALGLEKSWRENILSSVGDYGAIYARNLGDKSPFNLPRGANAPWSAGGLFAPPTAE